MTNGSVRTRHRIRAFEPRFIPTGETALVDRFKIAGPIGTIEYTDRARFHAALAQLGRGSKFMYQPPFRRSGTGFGQLVVRKGWLFGGAISFDAIQRPTSVLSGIAEVRVELDLNFTRYYANHFPAMVDSIERLSPSQALHANQARLARSRATALDGADNLLHDGHWLWPAPVGMRDRALACYLGHVMRFVNSSIVPRPRVLSSAQRPFGAYDLPWRNLTLRQYETYWEYRAPDAAATMEELRYRLETLSHAAERRQVRRPTPHSAAGAGWQDVRQGNVTILRVPLGTGINLSIYPKTADRLRLEVRYARNIAQLIAPRPVMAGLPSGPDRIVALARLAAQDAASRLSRLYPELHRRDSPGQVHVFHLVRLLGNVGHACEHDTILIIRILHLLLQTGGISQQEALVPPQILDQLVARGVLRRGRSLRRERARRYVLQAFYQPIVTLLRTHVGHSADRIRLGSGGAPGNL